MGVKFASLAHARGHLEAVQPGQHHVEDHEVEAAAPPGLGEAREGLGAVARHLDLVALDLEVELDPGGEVLLVLDDEDARHRQRLGGASRRPGRVMVKVEPRSGPALSAMTVPRCPFTTERTMKRPRPVPVRLRRTSEPMR